MAFVSLIMVYLFLVVMFLIGIFLVGLILLIVGLVKKKKAKNQGKKSPKVCIVLGSVFMVSPACLALFLVVFSIVKGTSAAIKSNSYENVTDKWRNENISNSHSAADEVVAEMLETADSGDSEKFAKFFTPNLQKEDSLKNDLDIFFESYPKGLSECELDGGTHGASGSYDHGSSVQTSSAGYECMLGDEWYSISFTFCFANTNSPDDVGITFFCIENFEAKALDEEYPEDQYLVCSIVDESKVTARMINGKPFVFKPTPERSITLEQMKTYLGEYDSLDKLIHEIGEPNVDKKYSNATGYDHYYELASEDGKPMYMYICTRSLTGGILYAYPCSDSDMFFDQGIDNCE